MHLSHRTRLDVASSTSRLFVLPGQLPDRVPALLALDISHLRHAQERLTAGPRDAERLAREAVRQGADVIVAVGGDGTIHEVVNGFFEADGRPVAPDGAGPTTRAAAAVGAPGKLQPALAILPFGTGSDFVRCFGWDGSVAAACERLKAHNARPLDIGMTTAAPAGGGGPPLRRAFACAATAGVSSLSATVIGRYKFLGAALGYPLSAVHALFKWRQAPCRVRVDGGEWLRVPNLTDVVVANAQHYGGGMKVAPTADPSDGQLDVVILGGFGVLEFARYQGRLRAGTHLDIPGVTCLRGSRVEVEMEAPAGGGPAPPLMLQMDGEVAGIAPFEFNVLPGALRLLC